MTYIGFSTKTHKFIARIFCKRFRHCAPVIKQKDKYYLYQFVNKNNIGIIPLTKRDLSILQKYGWVFIEYKYKFIKNEHALTCVQFTKQCCNIKNKKIITPYDLFKFITRK